MAEIELSVLSRQCLERRIEDKEILTEEVAAWEKRRNENSAPVDWRFTTEDARILGSDCYGVTEYACFQFVKRLNGNCSSMIRTLAN